MIDSAALCTDPPGAGVLRQWAANPGILATLARRLWSARAAAGPTAPVDGARVATLRGLRVGERGRVQGFADGGRAYRRKLLSMGLTPGVQFQVLRVAPLGDPVEVRVRGSNLSLRRDEAAALRVERLG